MARFYFDTAVGDIIDRDDDGVELADEAAARAEAQRALSDMIREKLPNGNHMDARVTVRNEIGQPIYTASLTLDGQRLG